ncbi:hypothetical protein [Streptomyces sp. NRRL WC-3725]|uniref:hypothetical protein n=1 Tax=Streptomyces sp. NRRL WC-3725 TaxID=1463933 RepID=UPI00068C68EC|nr:hypothetical protein [Streptomyces sp. NRRL WC-3725]
MADVTTIKPLNRDEEAFLRALGRVITLLPRVVDEKSPDDGRAWLAVLTSAGWTQLKQAWPTNLASVRRHVFSRLEGCDIAAAAKVLERIASV